jgi:hypothetical protein
MGVGDHTNRRHGSLFLEGLKVMLMRKRNLDPHCQQN